MTRVAVVGGLTSEILEDLGEDDEVFAIVPSAGELDELLRNCRDPRIWYLLGDGMTRMEFMLRFTLSHPDMHTTIVGTANPAHLADNLAAARSGPLPPEVYEAAKQRLAHTA